MVFHALCVPQLRPYIVYCVPPVFVTDDCVVVRCDLIDEAMFLLIDEAMFFLVDEAMIDEINFGISFLLTQR